MNKNKIYTCLIAGFILLSGCGIYSFTGGSISAGMKTVSVSLFENNAPLVVPSLSQNFKR